VFRGWPVAAAWRVRVVAAFPALGLLAGAALGLFLPDVPRLAGYALLILCAALSAWAWWTLRPRALAAAVACAFFCGGALLAADAWCKAWRPPLRAIFEDLARVERAEAVLEGRRLPEDDEAFAVVEGTLRADASPTESGVSLGVDVDVVERSAPAFAERIGQESFSRPSSPSRLSGAARGGIAVTVVGALAADRIGDWRAGRRVRMPVQLRRPSRYLDPGVPDHERALARRGTTLVGSVKSGALVEVLARGNWFQEAMSAARAFSRRAIHDAVGRWSAESAAIVAAIVVGDRAGLDDDLQRRLQDAGTYHVIAISGGNIAILAGLLLTAFRLAGWLGRTAMLSSIAALLLYASFVGNGASVDRATLMAVVYFGARAMDQRSPPLNALAVVAGLLVASDPLAIADSAFILTFGATLAILVVVPAVAVTTAHHEDAKSRACSWLRENMSSFRTMFIASVATEALVFPVGALIFSRVTFAGLALNFLAIPLMGVAQVAGMAIVPIAAASSHLAAFAGWIAHLGAAGLVGSAGLVRFAPLLAYRLAPPPWIVVALYYAAVVAWWVLWRQRVTTTGSGETRRARTIRCSAAGAAMASALWILIDPRTIVAAHGDGRLHVTFVDVGQGDSIFIVFPRGSTLLVDAGGVSAASSFDVGDRVVAPVVRDAGFRRLHALALTHGDPDHIGGAAAIVRDFAPREVWEGIPVPRLDALTRLRVDAQHSGSRWANVYAGDHVAIDDVEVVARHPRPADWERQKVRNDDSIVLELRWRDLSVVLTGDIGKAVERDIAAAFPPARLRIVKVPHHGSLTSSTVDFVTALHPQVAVVSAGRSNHFGHPVPEVLERYRSAGAEVFRTDRDGAVMLDSDGRSAVVRTFVGRHLSLP
jgi:competence protein ComEC